MPELTRPFRALRPRPEHASGVIAPPYDVVSYEEASALTHDRPASFLHISRPEIDLPPGTDPHSPAVYARGAQNLERLVTLGFVVRDAAPAYYVYRLSAAGHTQTGIALTASVAAYNANRVRKHELTRPDKENDRVANIEALNAQTGPVLCAYRANARIADCIARTTHNAALFAAVDHQAVTHTIWRVDDQSTLETLGNALNALDALYIADGHHRSAAAARVAQRRGGSGAASHDYFLAVAFPHDEMRILAYNRIVTQLGMTPQAFLAALAARCRVEASPTPVSPERSGRFGLYLPGQWYTLTMPDSFTQTRDPVARLDVSLLQDHVIGPLLGIVDPRTDARIGFVGGIRGLKELEQRVEGGHAAAAFSMFPTRMDQLMAVADASLLMPPKSTWFEPKLADGLLSHVLD